MTRPRFVLVGPPGAGKSTVGTILAARLRVALRETDADIETATGKRIGDIFIDDGEDVFRALERRAVATALSAHEGVLALGGGSVLDADTRAALAGHTVVLLAVGFRAATARVGLNRDRPLLLGNPRAQLRGLLEERRPIYAEVATVTVDTDGLQPDAVADAVLAALAALPLDRSGMARPPHAP